MAARTYYQILGVSRDATLEEISNARTALAKVYHPDANIQNGVDTTVRMQEILEAYRVLSNPETRKEYDLELGGGVHRVFKTFSFKEEIKAQHAEQEEAVVNCWNAACRLQEIIWQSSRILTRQSRKKTFFTRLRERLGQEEYIEEESREELEDLALQALEQVDILQNAEIPMDYWQPECMNWILIHWGQNPKVDYRTLVAQYDAEQNQNTTAAERLKSHTKNRQFQQSLNKLLTYA